MGSYNDMVKTMNKQPEPQDATCVAFGCNLRALPNQTYCSFHNNCDDVQRTTHAINSNARWISGYNTMLKWNSEDWTRYHTSLINNEFLPMNEGELPTMYLNRFYEKLTEALA